MFLLFSSIVQLESEKLAMAIEHEEKLGVAVEDTRRVEREKADAAVSQYIKERDEAQAELRKLEALRNERKSRYKVEQLTAGKDGEGDSDGDGDTPDSPNPINASNADGSGAGSMPPAGVVSPEVRDTISRAVREAAVLRRQLTDTESELSRLREERERDRDETSRSLRLTKLEFEQETKRMHDEYEAQLSVMRATLLELDPRYGQQ